MPFHLASRLCSRATSQVLVDDGEAHRGRHLHGIRQQPATRGLLAHRTPSIASTASCARCHPQLPRPRRLTRRRTCRTAESAYRRAAAATSRGGQPNPRNWRMLRPPARRTAVDVRRELLLREPIGLPVLTTRRVDCRCRRVMRRTRAMRRTCSDSEIAIWTARHRRPW